jgi:hypothetical protein
MKKKYLFILFMLVFNFGFSQFGMKYAKVEITLKDGKIINGFARLRSVDLEFKDTNKKNKRKILFEDINSTLFSTFNGKKNSIENKLKLVRLDLNPNFKRKVMFPLAQILYKKDKITIYATYKLAGSAAGSGGSIPGGGVSLPNNGSSSGAFDDYFCIVNQEKFPRLIYEYTNFFNTFKTMGKECFKDCPELSEKINSKEFTKESIKEIGDFYNSNCN